MSRNKFEVRVNAYPLSNYKIVLDKEQYIERERFVAGTAEACRMICAASQPRQPALSGSA